MPAYRSLRFSLAAVGLLAACAALVAACSEPEERAAEAPATAVQTARATAAATPAEGVVVESTTLTFQLHPTIGELCRVLAPKAYFEFDSAKLTWGDKVVIDEIVRCLNRDDMKGESLRLVGRASVVGPAEYNRELALERAKAVADGLVRAGLSRDRLTLVARGEKGFGVPATRAGLAFQRRVDLQLESPRPRTVEVTYWDVDTDTRMNPVEFYTHTADLLGVDGYDRDNDGGLSPSETAAFVFNAWDADRDKVLDEDEWGFGAEGWYPGQAAFGSFVSWDENKDGRITPVEWILQFEKDGVFDAWNLDGDRRLYDHEVALGLFRMYDGNKDGQLDEREAKQIRAWGFGAS